MIRGPLLHADVRSQLNGVRPVTARLTADPKLKLAPNTQRNYVLACAVLQRRFPGVRVNEFERRHIDEFFTLDDAGRARPRVGSKGWTHATVNGYVKGFNFAFAWALHAGLIETNPCQHIVRDWGQPGIYHRQGVWLTGAEIERLCDPDVGDDLLEARNRFICRLLVGTGLREFELASLRWDHVTGSGNALQLRVLGKGSKYRSITPLAVCRDAVDNWRAVQRQLRGSGPFPTDPVVWASRSIPEGGGRIRHQPLWEVALGTNGLQNVVAAAGQRIGQPRLRPHDLRRSHAGFLEENQISLRGIQHQLGHSSVTTTERYLTYRPGQFARELADRGI